MTSAEIAAEIARIKGLLDLGKAQQEARDFQRDVDTLLDAKLAAETLAHQFHGHQHPELINRLDNIFVQILFYIVKGIRREVIDQFRRCPTFNSRNLQLDRIAIGISVGDEFIQRSRFKMNTSAYHALLQFHSEIKSYRDSLMISSQSNEMSSISSSAPSSNSSRKRSASDMEQPDTSSSLPPNMDSPESLEALADRYFDLALQSADPYCQLNHFTAAIDVYSRSLMLGLKIFHTKPRGNASTCASIFDEAVGLTWQQISLRDSIAHAREKIIMLLGKHPEIDTPITRQAYIHLQLEYFSAIIARQNYLRRKFVLDNRSTYPQLQLDSPLLNDYSFLRQYFITKLDKFRGQQSLGMHTIIQKTVEYAAEINCMLRTIDPELRQDHATIQAFDTTPTTNVSTIAPPGWDPQLFLSRIPARIYTHANLASSDDNASLSAQSPAGASNTYTI